MTLQTPVNVSTSPDDGKGDKLRDAFIKINERFQDIASLLQNKGDWTTGTQYIQRDYVIEGGEAYVCVIAHTAGTFATDLASGKWASVDALELRADLASTAAGKGAELVGFKQLGTGAVDRTALAKLRESVSVKDFGSVGDGVANDATPVTTVLQSGTAWFPQDTTYNLNGQDITISNSVTCYFGRGVKFTNGRLQFRPTDTEKRVSFHGDFNIEQGSLRVGGYADVSHTDPIKPDVNAVSFSCSNINVKDMYSTAEQSVHLLNLKNSSIGVVTVSGAAGSQGMKGVLLQDIYDSNILGIDVDGTWTAGVEFDQSSLRPAYSFTRSKCGFIKAKKTNADVSGQHGVYFHGCKDSQIGTVEALGWGQDISSSADLKFRDANGCEFDRVSVGRFRITSDDNYSFTQITKDNTFNNVSCSVSFALATSGTGYALNNTIANLRTPNMGFDNNKAVERGVVLTGFCEIGVSTTGATINATGIAFESATVTLLNEAAFTGPVFSAKETIFNGALSFKPTQASTMKLNGVTVNGDINHIGNFTTHNLIWTRTHATGNILVESSSVSRVTNAFWRFVSSDQPEIADTLKRPDNKNYRYVAFADAVYNSLG